MIPDVCASQNDSQQVNVSLAWHQEEERTGDQLPELQQIEQNLRLKEINDNM